MKRRDWFLAAGRRNPQQPGSLGQRLAELDLVIPQSLLVRAHRVIE